MTPVNDRDVLLQAAERYTDTGTSKVLLLAVSTPLFHLSVNGTPTPAQIAMQATAVNITGAVVEFSASSGATLTVAGDTCTLNYTDMTTDSVTITATVTDNGQTYTATQVITKVQDGVVGKDGKDGTAGSQYATATLYKWSTVNPGLPAGTATLTWSTGVNTSYSGSDGWAVSVPSNPAPGVSLWTATKQISAVAGTQTTDVTYASGAAVQSIAANGATGPAGTKNAIATAYAWASGPAPTIAGSATWTWTAADYDNVPQYWSKTKPNAPGLGYTLYEARFGLVDSSGATTSAINWTNATVTGIGYMPTNGSTGSNGASVMVAYTLVDGNSLATTPSQSTPVAGQNLPATGTWGETRAWQSTVPVAGVNQSVFQSNGVYNPVANSTTWGLPYISVWRVGSLSAISANLGAITGGSINLGNGTFTVDNNGNAVMRSLSVQDAGGNVILGVNKPLADSYVPTSAQNSQLVPSITAAQTAANQAAVTTFSPLVSWNFTNGGGLQGWYGENFTTVTPSATFITVTPGNSDPMLGCDNLSINGAVYNKVRMRLRRTAGSSWDGIVFFNREGPDGASVLPDPKLVIGEWTTIEWDMSATGNWPTETITHIRIDLGKSAQDVFDVQWIAVGRYGVGSDELAAAAAAAQTAANTANAAITAISSDNVLSKGEKSQVVLDWSAINGEMNGLETQANSLSVDHSALTSAFLAAANYLSTLSPPWYDTATDTPIVGADFRTNFANYYTAKQALINAMAAKAATTANWSSVASKPADSAILNSYVSVGGNLCYNADFSNGLDGWPLNSDGNSCIYTVCSGTTPNGAGLDWTLNRGVGQGTNTLQVHENGTGQGVYFELFSDPIPISLGTKYCISAYTGAHRCVVDVFAYVYDLNGNIVSNWGAGADTNNELSAGGQFLNDYHRHAVTGTALAGQAYIRVSLRKLPTYLDARNFQDSWMMVTRVQVEEIAANATGAGPWNPPGISAIAYKSMSDATTAINNIASDGILSKGEKPDLILRWNTCDAEKASLDSQAGALGVDHSLYDIAHDDLSNYLLSIPNGWSNTATDSPIDPATFKAKWLAYNDQKQKLINTMAAKAATMASGVTLSTSGELLGAGGGQVQTLPVTDGARTVDYAPSDYGLVHVKEFKQCAYIGLASAGATYCTLETIKPWHDNSGGNATQWAYVSSTETWKRSGGCGDTSWGPWIRDLDRSLYTGDLNATAGATWGVNVSGAPQDVSNLVKKSNFDDGAIGGWPAQGVEVVGGGNYTSVPYTHELVTHTRDCIENNNAFNVTPGEVLYFSTWMNTEASTYDGFFGLFVYNTAGNIVDYVKATGLPAGRGWTYITGSYTVRSNGAYAYPWLQMEGFDFSSGNWLRATGMWIGRHERSATNGATFGVNISGQITPNNVATYIAPNSVGNGQIGGDIYSSNWNGSTAQWGSGWYLERATGNFYGNAVKLRGAIMSGSYYRWEWPTDGGNGYYLGAEGLLLGNPSLGSWLQLESNGNFHSQQFTIVGGNATFSGALSGRVVNAENINVTSLDAVSARIGTLRTATYGARSEISDNGIQIFNSANLAVIQIGYF